MSIKRYSTNSTQPARFDETGDGRWVKFDDHTTCVARLNMQIAELQNQLDINRDTVAEFVRREQQLAAENAALQSARPQPSGPQMMNALNALNAYEKDRDEEPETGMLNAFFALRDSVAGETPATDAWLRAQRTGAVKAALDSVGGMDVDCVQDAIGRDRDYSEAFVDGMLNLHGQITHYLNQLRAGKV